MPTARLAIPPVPEQARTARLVAGAAARRSGVDPDVLDDVRLAVAEAVARAVLRAGSGHPEPVEIAMTDDVGHFAIAVSDRVPTAEGEHDEEELSLSLMQALADTSTVSGNEHGGQTVVLTWPTQE